MVGKPQELVQTTVESAGLSGWEPCSEGKGPLGAWGATQICTQSTFWGPRRGCNRPRGPAGGG